MGKLQDIISYLCHTILATLSVNFGYMVNIETRALNHELFGMQLIRPPKIWYTIR